MKPKKLYHLYCLAFLDGTCYYGMTENPKRREKEHSKKWPTPFRFLNIGSFEKKSDCLAHEAFLILWLYLKDKSKCHNRFINKMRLSN